MLEAIATLLIMVGFVCLVGFSAAWIAAAVDGKRVELTITERDAYQDGLDAAARISGMAFESEQLLHQAGLRAEREEEEK